MLELIECNDPSMSRRKTDKTIVTKSASVFAEDFNRAKYVFNSKSPMNKIVEVPESPQLGSAISITLHKKSRSNPEDKFESSLSKFAYATVEKSSHDHPLKVQTEALQ